MGGRLGTHTAPAPAPTPNPANPTPVVTLRTFQKNDLRYLSDEELERRSLGGALELRRLGEKIVTMKMSAVQDPRQFEREVAAVSVFARHPNVVEILGIHTSDMASFVVVEYLEGGSLEHLLSTAPEFTWEQVIVFGQDICKGMAHVHNADVVHRNLKPSNILVVSTKVADPVHLKVSDFGLARITAAKMTGRRGPVGYLAPETLKKSEAEYTNAIDVYSFGIILWQLITRGEPFHGIPFVNIPAETLRGTRPPIPEAVPEVFTEFLQALWNQDPKERPTFAEAQETLAQAFDQRSTFPPIASCRSA